MSKIKRYLDKVKDFNCNINVSLKYAKNDDKDKRVYSNRGKRVEYLLRVIMEIQDDFNTIFKEELETLKELEKDMSEIKQYLDKVEEYNQVLDIWVKDAKQYNKEEKSKYLLCVIILLKDNFNIIFKEELETLKELEEDRGE